MRRHFRHAIDASAPFSIHTLPLLFSMRAAATMLLPLLRPPPAFTSPPTDLFHLYYFHALFAATLTPRCRRHFDA